MYYSCSINSMTNKKVYVYMMKFHYNSYLGVYGFIWIHMEIKKNLITFCICYFFTQTVFVTANLVSDKKYKGLFRGLFSLLTQNPSMYRIPLVEHVSTNSNIKIQIDTMVFYYYSLLPNHLKLHKSYPCLLSV